VTEQIELLFKLQEEDETLDRLRRLIHEGPQRIEELESKVAALKKSLEADKRRIEEVKRVQRQYEAEVEDGVAHIRKSKARLMTIKSNKEYQALLKEIEDTERTNGKKEDKILGCMEEIESVNEIVQDKEKDLSAILNHLENEKSTVDAEVRNAREQIYEVEKHRVDTLKTVDPKLLARYEHIKSRSGGIAVAFVEDATCGGCHMNIPPQIYNELQRGDSLMFCPNCERIIFWKGRAPAA